MSEQIKSTHQWQLWLIVIALGAPLPLAWAAWYWQIGIPDGKNVSGVLLPNTSNLFSWPLQPLGENYHAKNPIHLVQQKEPWYLVIECTALCRNDEFWRLHRALGRDADRLVRYTLTSTPSSVINYDDPLPGSYWWYLNQSKQTQQADQKSPVPSSEPSLDTFAKDYAIWLADPSGQIVLAYTSDVHIKTLLKDIRRVLRRNPEKPSWMQSPPTISKNNQPPTNTETGLAQISEEKL